jgi:hypothetical protein
MTPTPRASALRAKRFGLWALLFCVGCASPAVVSLTTGPRDYTPNDYEDVYERWTRSEEDFAWGRMTDVLRVTATFESWEFRWAYVVRYADDHSLVPAARDEMLRATLDDAGTHHRFFVTLAGDQFRESNLAGRGNAWRVLLIAPDGSQSEPIDLERVRRPTAAQQVYFPSVTTYRETFRLAFPATREDGTAAIPAGADHIILRFTGARGRVDLRWDLEP